MTITWIGCKFTPLVIVVNFHLNEIIFFNNLIVNIFFFYHRVIFTIWWWLCLKGDVCNNHLHCFTGKRKQHAKKITYFPMPLSPLPLSQANTIVANAIVNFTCYPIQLSPLPTIKSNYHIYQQVEPTPLSPLLPSQDAIVTFTCELNQLTVATNAKKNLAIESIHTS